MTTKELNNRVGSVLCRHSEIMELLNHADWKDDSFKLICELIMQSHINEISYISAINEQDLKNEIDVPDFIK